MGCAVLHKIVILTAAVMFSAGEVRLGLSHIGLALAAVVGLAGGFRLPPPSYPLGTGGDLTKRLRPHFAAAVFFGPIPGGLFALPRHFERRHRIYARRRVSAIMQRSQRSQEPNQDTGTADWQAGRR